MLQCGLQSVRANVKKKVAKEAKKLKITDQIEETRNKRMLMYLFLQTTTPQV
ncbi:hypothetical protein DVH05_004642 [Phytophthora capsici]|nr:hypothetical protein DVH05_004642 [Phytophthora capsici]